jgi:multidrug efflux pump subunit AcrB
VRKATTRFTSLDGKPTIGIAVFLQSGANALDVANAHGRR